MTRSLFASFALTFVAACSSGPGEVGPPGVPCDGCVDAASLTSEVVTDAHLAATGITTRSKLPAQLCYQDEANTFSADQTIQSNLTVGGAVAVAGAVTVAGSLTVGASDAPTATLDVRGEVKSEGLYQVGTNPLVPYAISTRRYVAEAGPNVTGQVIPIDNTIMSDLCRDVDGCQITLAMINWDGTKSVASRRFQLFVAEEGNYWRLGDDDIDRIDANNATSDKITWDCVFTDAETKTSNNNGRSDAGPGFGLLNLLGVAGSYADATTVCRVIIED